MDLHQTGHLLGLEKHRKMSLMRGMGVQNEAQQGLQHMGRSVHLWSVKY